MTRRCRPTSLQRSITRGHPPPWPSRLRPALFREAKSPAHVERCIRSTSGTRFGLSPSFAICTWTRGFSSRDFRVAIQPERMSPRTKSIDNPLLLCLSSPSTTFTEGDGQRSDLLADSDKLIFGWHCYKSRAQNTSLTFNGQAALYSVDTSKKEHSIQSACAPLRVKWIPEPRRRGRASNATNKRDDIYGVQTVYNRNFIEQYKFLSQQRARGVKVSLPLCPSVGPGQKAFASRNKSLEVYLNKACPALSRGTRARAPGVLELLSVPVTTPSRGHWHLRESLPGLVPGSPIVSGEDKFSYREIGSSRLDCGNEVCHRSRLVPRKTETRTGEVCFNTLNVCGGKGDKIDDVCELMKDRRLDILCINETKRKDMSTLLENPEEFWADVRDILMKCNRKERIVILGDFNVWVGVQREGYEKVLGLEKAYDRVKINDLWRTLSMHGVSSGLIQASHQASGSSACIRINGAYTDWFDIRRGVRQGYVALPWLFDLFMGSCQYDLKEYECGLKMDKLSVKCLLYADD
ncbi:hypothetical protein EVAR_80558_1 [Eumeta japonica]|uniref:Reverse transcriptase domain-containing protein n=1 Tax=Eumeta variegata TaxID=151549 RepID=A0A4C1TMN7_EUMVA|nr:hypothetical protein EVAR_80558_1 [Eumeta japonica]